MSVYSFRRPSRWRLSTGRVLGDGGSHPPALQLTYRPLLSGFHLICNATIHPTYYESLHPMYPVLPFCFSFHRNSIAGRRHLECESRSVLSLIVHPNKSSLEKAGSDTKRWPVVTFLQSLVFTAHGLKLCLTGNVFQLYFCLFVLMKSYQTTQQAHRQDR